MKYYEEYCSSNLATRSLFFYNSIETFLAKRGIMENFSTPESIASLRVSRGLTHEELAKLLAGEEWKKYLSTIVKCESGEMEIPSILQNAYLGLHNNPEVFKKEKKEVKNAQFTFIDLFAGIGGMRMAFEKAGGRCVFTSEYDKYPAKMYEDNFGDRPAGDITKIHEKDIPAHDVLVAGFPCQPFSIAGVSKKNSMGRKHGFEDATQGTLFFDVARIIKHHQPRMFLLENVKNLKSHDKGNTFRVIEETLKELGYYIETRIVDGATMVPQHRERIYIVGWREDGVNFNFPEFEKNTGHRLGDILFEDREVEKKYTLSDALWSALQRHAEKHKAKGNGFGFGLVGRDDIARTLSARYYKDGSEILIRQKGRNPRRLTPRECARLMGFGDNYAITVSDTRAYKCFGNSVVVPVVERIAKQMAILIKNNEGKDLLQ